MTLHRSAIYVALAAVLAASPVLALGQDAAPQATTDKGNGSSKQKVQNLDAIQVSATKRETPLQQTPVAVTAITADALDKERVMTVQDITKLVPGLQGTSQGDHGVTTLTMRGIGNDSAKTEYADPEVALFVDGVYAPRAETATSLLLDIDSVQVLDLKDGQLRELCNPACGFTYRTSIFNTSERGRYIILRVTYALTPEGPPRLAYADLQKYFAGRNGTPTLTEVREAVRRVRAGKAGCLR